MALASQPIYVNAIGPDGRMIVSAWLLDELPPEIADGSAKELWTGVVNP